MATTTLPGADDISQILRNGPFARSEYLVQHVVGDLRQLGGRCLDGASIAEEVVGKLRAALERRRWGTEETSQIIETFAPQVIESLVLDENVRSEALASLSGPSINDERGH